MKKIKDVIHHSLYCALRYHKLQINFVQNKIIKLKLDISKEIEHDKALNITSFNPYVKEWKTELKTCRKMIQNHTKSIKIFKSKIKNNQRFMNDIRIKQKTKQ